MAHPQPETVKQTGTFTMLHGSFPLELILKSLCSVLVHLPPLEIFISLYGMHFPDGTVEAQIEEIYHQIETQGLQSIPKVVLENLKLNLNDNLTLSPDFQETQDTRNFDSEIISKLKAKAIPPRFKMTEEGKTPVPLLLLLLMMAKTKPIVIPRYRKSEFLKLIKAYMDGTFPDGIEGNKRPILILEIDPTLTTAHTYLFKKEGNRYYRLDNLKPSFKSGLTERNFDQLFTNELLYSYVIILSEPPKLDNFPVLQQSVSNRPVKGKF